MPIPTTAAPAQSIRSASGSERGAALMRIAIAAIAIGMLTQKIERQVHSVR